MFRSGGKTCKLLTNILRCQYMTLYEQELVVSPFCNVHVKVPFNVELIPLDVHKYRNCDKVIVKLSGKSEYPAVYKLLCSHTNDIVSISSNSNEFLHDVTCNIEAPIKANIEVTTSASNVNLANFNGESITLRTGTGNIAASRCYCNKITLTSCIGNITCVNVLQAGDIFLKTGRNGSILTDRLQDCTLKAETENGSIKIASSYCNNSSFTTKTGRLDLNNAHKNCQVSITNKGVLNMTGFDGVLMANINEGEANVQIARIEDDSEIKIIGNGMLNLKLLQTCLQNTDFKIAAKNLHLDENLDFNKSTAGAQFILKSHSKANASFSVNCQKSNVIIQNTTWMEMFNLKLTTQK